MKVVRPERNRLAFRPTNLENCLRVFLTPPEAWTHSDAGSQESNR
jgi:hypothetical protein